MRRKSAFVVALFLFAGCLSQAPTPKETPQPTTQQPQTTSPPKENLLIKYAQEKGMSEDSIKILLPAGLDGILTEERKSAVDYLLELPKEYQKIAVEKVMEDGKLTKEDLKYLLDFQNEISKAKRILADLKQTNFTLEDEKQTDLEKKYLAEPEKYSKDLFSYYISELKNSNADLASQLEKLPELNDGNFYSAEKLEALEDIVYLSLQATNPEVKEAFALMMKGGIPDQKDFNYSVPKYNTELEVLFWLAEQNEFKKDDTLALAIAMDNGLYVTMGDDEVRKAVKKDTNDLLNFFRETNEWQRERGFYLLEEYPLEAKICISRTSSIGMIDGPNALDRFLGNRIDIRHYRWIQHDTDLLLKMRQIAIKENWIDYSTDSTVKNLEEYFYFSGKSKHWEYSTRTGDIPGVTESMIEVNGEKIPDHGIYNLGFYLNRYLKIQKGLGDCGDETYFMEAWLKSLGISTNFVIHSIIVDGKYMGHVHMIYYEPITKTWKAYEKQLDDSMYHSRTDVSFYVFIFKPPVMIAGYFVYVPIKDARIVRGGIGYVTQYTPPEFRRIYKKGIPTSQMKQWLLYS